LSEEEPPAPSDTPPPPTAKCLSIRTRSVSDAENDLDGTLIQLQRRFNPSNLLDTPVSPDVTSGNTESARRNSSSQVFSLSSNSASVSNNIPQILEPRVGPPPVTITWELKGKKLKALIDSGSTVDILSARAVFLLRLGLRELDEVLKINLGTHGAKSKTQHWCATDFVWRHVHIPQYRFFVTPLRGYDVILGTPFLSRVNCLVGVSPPRLLFNDGHEYVLDDSSFPTTEASTCHISVSDLGPIAESDLVAEGYCRTRDFDIDMDMVVQAMVNSINIDDDRDTELAYIQEATERILQEYSDVFPESLPPGLPPLREVNHRIRLIDPDKKLRPKVYTIPLRYEQQIRDQINAFCDSDWFFPLATDDAAPAFVVPKKEPTQGRLVVDLRERNANTIRDESPIPDMRAIRERVARHKYRSQFDFTKSYHQIRVEPDCVKHTAFKLPFGTFGSNVVHMGDLNAPATLHRMLFTMFRKHIGKFIDVFFDNVFVYSDDPREHVRHVRTMLDILRTHQFYLNPGDVDLFAKEMVALGALINDQGILVESKRVDKIRDWPTPKNKNDIMRFMGTVQWVSDHYPYLAIVAASLTELTGDVPWEWRDIHEEAFRAIKDVVPQVLHPIDWETAKANGWHVWVVSDACIYGCGAWIGMGPSIAEASPARYHSRKFNRAQQNYFTTEQELLGIVTALEAFQDLLLGHPFRVATDHQPLKTFWQQKSLSRRQHCWAQILAKFDFVVDYLPGKLNGFADGLSRVYEISPDDRLADHEYCHLDDDFIDQLVPPMAAAIFHEGGEEPPTTTTLDRTAIMATIDAEFAATLRKEYQDDRFFRLILEKPDHFSSFTIKEHLIYVELDDGWRLCLPKGTLRGKVIDQVHSILGHLGARKTVEGMRRYFWWGSLVGDVTDYCRSCETCARVKSRHQPPFGLLHSLPIPSRPWQMVACDFVGPLPKSKYRGVSFDYLITFTCAHSKQCHLVRWHTNGTAEQFADIFYEEVVRLHGLPEIFVSDRDCKVPESQGVDHDSLATRFTDSVVRTGRRR
jgi:hypothetical protein